MLKKELTASLLCCDLPENSEFALRPIASVVHMYISGKSHDSTAKHPNLPFHRIKILPNVPLNMVLAHHFNSSIRCFITLKDSYPLYDTILLSVKILYCRSHNKIIWIINYFTSLSWNVNIL